MVRGVLPGAKSGHYEIKRSFEIHVLPTLGKLPARDVSIHEWLAVLEQLAKTSPGIADRVLVNTRQMYKWGVKRHLVPHNPLSEINAAEDLQIRKQVTSRSLSHDEIRWLWQALEGSRISQKNAIFLKLCLLYGCRNGELRLSQKKDYDFESGVWTIPAENHKIGGRTGKPLKRPIIEPAEELLRQVMADQPRNRYAFCNTGSDEHMGPASAGKLPYNLRQWLRRHRKYEMAHWSTHDLRRTARTNFSTLTEPHVAEIMLGHKLPGQWPTYGQYEYLEEQRRAYEKWW